MTTMATTAYKSYIAAAILGGPSDHSERIVPGYGDKIHCTFV